MIQICVPNKKNSRKKTNVTFLNFFFKCNDYEHQNTQYFLYY